MQLDKIVYYFKTPKVGGNLKACHLIAAIRLINFAVFIILVTEIGFTFITLFT